MGEILRFPAAHMQDYGKMSCLGCYLPQHGSCGIQRTADNIRFPYIAIGIGGNGTYGVFPLCQSVSVPYYVRHICVVPGIHGINQGPDSGIVPGLVFKPYSAEPGIIHRRNLNCRGASHSVSVLGRNTCDYGCLMILCHRDDYFLRTGSFISGDIDGCHLIEVGFPHLNSRIVIIQCGALFADQLINTCFIIGAINSECFYILVLRSSIRPGQLHISFIAQYTDILRSCRCGTIHHVGHNNISAVFGEYVFVAAFVINLELHIKRTFGKLSEVEIVA